jgi:hypothetical protein
MPKVTVKVPKSVMSLPENHRDAILAVLAKAARLPDVMEVTHVGGDEHNIWSRNHDLFMADTEDDFYETLDTPAWAMLQNVFAALDLPTGNLDMKKSLTPEYWEWEGLQKAGNKRKKSKLDDAIDLTKKKRDKFLKYLQGMNPFSKQQLKKLDDVLKTKLPDYAKVAESFMTRAGFIGKIQSQSEKEAFEIAGALVDRYPSTIKAADKEGIVLTKREAGRYNEKYGTEGRKVKILPLTPLESKAVQHASHQAADKLTEVSERHRAGIRQMILQAQRERWEPERLAQSLFDMYGDQNRDWRRVALTELAFAANDAYLSGVEEGETVIGMGSTNACKHCKQYVIGKQFLVTHKLPKNTYEHEMKYVWAGKSNYGRRVATYQPAIPMHPNCRCRWHRVSKFYSVDDKGAFKLKTTAQLIQEERARRGLPPDPNLK